MSMYPNERDYLAEEAAEAAWEAKQERIEDARIEKKIKEAMRANKALFTEVIKKGLYDFNPFIVISYITDPGYGYGHVKMLLIRFADKAYGLCIWDTNRKEFISEPSELDDYNFESLEELYSEYPGLRI